MESTKKILSRIKKKKIKIGIVGLGYVGLQLAKTFLLSGHEIYGFEKDKKKINFIKKKKSYINYIKDSEIKKMFNKKFKIENNFSHINLVDVIILCLPTPIKNKNVPDISIIKQVMKSIKRYLKPSQILILESTTFPGTTEEILLPMIRDKFIVGKNFFMVYSPERNLTIN